MEWVDGSQPVLYFKTQHDDYNDPHLSIQHAFRSMQANQTHQWAAGRVVSVAVVETGMDIDNLEFEKQIQSVKNIVDKDELTFRKDVVEVRKHI